jgi:phenylalanyl-tRNA synthetase beta chain
VKLPYTWLCELVKVSDGPASVAAALGLRGFEVASIELGPQPVIDFEITANRPDCLSVIGLAREAAAAYQLPLQLPDGMTAAAGTRQPSLDGPAIAGSDVDVPLDVTIEDAELCPRYCAQIFELRPGVTSPDWLRERLEASGVRSIGAVVDVTNYVMLEMGQPTHAFDYAKLAGRALRIRRANAGERLRTLDGVDRALDRQMLVIADAAGPQAVAGVMGGADSEIGAGTRLMVLESAYFKPPSVRRTSKTLTLKTEASTRFERGADVDAAPVAIARAAALLQQIGAAQPRGPIIDRYPSRREPLTLVLRASRLERVLGMRVADGDVPTILEPLGFRVADDRKPGGEDRGSRPGGEAALSISHGSSPSNRRWSVTVPSFRVDVLREIDLIEEIARHDGYVNLPATFPELTGGQPEPDARTLRDRLVRQVLTACGLSEAMTFAFIEASAAAPFAAPDAIVHVANPLSEKFAVLRPSLLPGLLDAAAHNRRREHHDVRLFESGTRFTGTGETRAVAGVWSGAGLPLHWSGGNRAADFYDVKGVVETLCGALGIEAAFEPAAVPYLVEGRAAEVFFRLKPEATDTPSGTAADSVASGSSRKDANAVRDSVASGFSRKDANAVRDSVVAADSVASGFSRKDANAVGESVAAADSVASGFSRKDANAVRDSVASGFSRKDANAVRDSVASGFSRKVSKVGLVGQIVPSIAEARGFPDAEPIYAFELDLDAIARLRRGDDLRAAPLPRFPSIVRDLSVLVDSTLPAAAVRGTIRSAAPSTLTSAIEFDRYRGKGVPDERVSLSVRLTFRSTERTLTDVEVDDAMDRIVAALAAAHNAVRR